jgi:hypothetical protein
MHTESIQLLAETSQVSRQIQDRERSLRLRGVLAELSLRHGSVTELSLSDGNVLFARTRAQFGDKSDRPTLH